MSIQRTAIAWGFKTLRRAGLSSQKDSDVSQKQKPANKNRLDTSSYTRARQKDSGDVSPGSAASSSGDDSNLKKNARIRAAEERIGLRTTAQHYSWREVYDACEVDGWGHE